jgi:hypothetical protein
MSGIEGLQLGGYGEEMFPVSNGSVEPPFVVQSALICRAGSTQLWHHLVSSSPQGGGRNVWSLIQAIIWAIRASAISSI